MENKKIINKTELIMSAPKPHIPEKLPVNLSSVFLDQDIIRLMSKANHAVGAYRGFLINTVNPMLLISPITTQEALLSSKLEGTHATIEDVINFEAGNETDIKQDDMQEILNYREALYYSLEKMATINDDSEESKHMLPLSSRLIKDMHKILLNNTRGASKRPGEFKTQQNYVGGSQSITFTPLPPELTLEYMANLESYIHYDEIDPLIQSALLHCQFEMIHPFYDGNGRIGRLLIPLFLYYKEILPFPTFYMSSFFESDRALYLQKLSSVSKDGDLTSWIKYYLEGIIVQAQRNTVKAKQLLDIYDDFKNICINEVNSKYAIPILDQVFQRPAFKANQIAHEIAISPGTLYSVLNSFVDHGILKTDGKQRNTTYFCTSILDLL